MFEYESTDRRGARPPIGFDVMRASELDPEEGREDRWLFHGRICGRGYLRAGFDSRESACRAAWIASDAARAAAARDGRLGPDAAITYSVHRGTWEAMEASLLAQVIADAGSIRRAAKVLGLPKSTLSAWVIKHRERGTWPA
jgi:hypothetical protein